MPEARVHVTAAGAGGRLGSASRLGVRRHIGGVDVGLEGAGGGCGAWGHGLCRRFGHGFVADCYAGFVLVMGLACIFQGLIVPLDACLRNLWGQL